MISNPPGVEDIFPDAVQKWNFVINTACEVFRLHNYRELIIPIMEFTEVFARGLGDDTDIVSKEMFSFEDRGGRSLTLRPEGTASVVRAFVGNGEYNRLSLNKFFYRGPMFRAERPQKGRLRQFNQFGAELMGSGDPYYDYEIISMMNTISEQAGIIEYTLLVNSIGCSECRPAYTNELYKYYKEHFEQLCKDCRNRLDKNILRLLDCKEEQCKALKNNAPVISQYLCTGCRDHHDTLKDYLNNASIAYREDPYLVRGLDYYTKTTFEFVTSRLGGQNAFAAGGRYDKLVEIFGGKPTPAIGFAAGIERMLLLIDDIHVPEQCHDVYCIYSGPQAFSTVLKLSDELRRSGISSDLEPGAGSFKSQFKKADRVKTRFAVILAEEEMMKNTCTIKDMATGEQKEIGIEKCVEFLQSML